MKCIALVEDQVLGEALTSGSLFTRKEWTSNRSAFFSGLTSARRFRVDMRLNERDTLGRRYDDVLDRGYELESVNEAILILAKLSDLLGRKRRLHRRHRTRVLKSHSRVGRAGP
jgi:hypothetical protein